MTTRWETDIDIPFKLASSPSKHLLQVDSRYCGSNSCSRHTGYFINITHNWLRLIFPLNWWVDTSQVPVQVVYGAGSIWYSFLADSTLCLCIVNNIEMVPDFASFPRVTHFLYYIFLMCQYCLFFFLPLALFLLFCCYCECNYPPSPLHYSAQPQGANNQGLERKKL